MYTRMLKRTFSILVFSISLVFAQSSDSNLVASSRHVKIKQWDDNLFYCNWHNQQTYCYFVEAPDTLGGAAIQLVKGEEKFTLPRFGTLWSVFKKAHKGLDIDLKTGDTVLNMFDGVVRYAQYNKGGFGNLVIVRHYNGLETYYGHLSKIKVSVDQKIKSGDLIGLGGSTGRSYNPHLHLEVRYQDHPLDPFTFINWEGKCLKTDILALDKKAFSPWDLGLPPADLSRPDYTTVSNPPIVLTENTTEIKSDTGVVQVTTQNTQDNSNSANYKYYTIKKGDTLYSIAKANGTTLQQICDWNGIKDANKIFLGQKIRVR